MANKGRNIDDSELSLWGRFIEGINPLHKNKINTPTPPPAPQKKKTRHPPSPQPAPTLPPQSTQKIPKDLDRATLKKLQSGKMDIEGRIDLHGKTQDQAYHTLKGFLTSAFDQQKRCVLVITGKGGRHKSDDVFSSIPQGQGVLKTRLPDWLSTSPLNDIVLRHEQAQQKHGGGGAFYIYLKRQRTP
jgi:DNA-nicking Smr family endonuclease